MGVIVVCVALDGEKRSWGEKKVPPCLIFCVRRRGGEGNLSGCVVLVLSVLCVDLFSGVFVVFLCACLVILIFSMCRSLLCALLFYCFCGYVIIYISATHCVMSGVGVHHPLSSSALGFKGVGCNCSFLVNYHHFPERKYHLLQGRAIVKAYLMPCSLQLICRPDIIV